MPKSGESAVLLDRVDGQTQRTLNVYLAIRGTLKSRLDILQRKEQNPRP
jgi:hypothetical protein